MNTRLQILLLGIIFLLAFILRFYKLGQIPYGLYQDETAIGYNAYSIRETGKDEHGESWPLYFKSFGDYKLPVYIYLTIVPIHLFGVTEFAVRFPSALFGFLTVIVFYFFVLAITGNRMLALISTVLLSINPWHLHYNRATFEVSISLFLFLLGGLLLRKGAFLFGTICFIISLYSYNLTRLLAPALYIFFLVFYAKQIKRVSKQESILTIIISVLLLIPFISTFFSSAGVPSAGGTLIFSSAVIQSPLIELRSYLVDFPSFFSKPFFNIPLLTLWKYLENVISYFSAPFFFVSGSAHGNHGIGNVGQFYLFEFPLVVLGLFTIAKEKFRWGIIIVLWGTLVILVASLTREAPHATRSFFLIPVIIICSALGVQKVLTWIRRVRSFRLKFAILIFSLIIIQYNMLFYLTSYYIRFPVLYAKSWRLADKELSLFLKENEGKYDKVIFDQQAGFIYSSLLFYSRNSPYEFQKTAVWEKDDREGFSMPIVFGKYEFKTIDWQKDYPYERTLYITSPERKPKDILPVKTIYYPKRPVVLSVKEEIVRYPIEEVAYLLVESK